jgi:hypothetical protein
MCVSIEVLGADFRQTAGAGEANFQWSKAEFLPGD